MPYYIEKDNAECKSGWAVTGDTGVVHGCHTTKASAIKQAVAISLATDEPFVGERAAIDSLSIGDYVSWNVLDPEIVAEVEAVEGQMAVVRIYEYEEGIFTPTDKLMIINVFKLEKIPAPEMLAEVFEETPDASSARGDALMSNDNNASYNKWMRAAWAIKAKLEGLPEEARSLGKVETRTNHIDFEIRQDGDGMTFEGYAAVWNSPSQPLPFTEVIKPGAFKRSLQGRHRMMLLWNHNASEPLASTRNGSLKLVEDERGLKVTAKLANTQTGRDVAELVRSGVIDAMSFGFQVKKDSWSADGNSRTLHEVAVHEVSLVSYPAYEGTAGLTSVREARDIDADLLTQSLIKLESGEELDTEQAKLITEVVEKLQKPVEAEAVDTDVLALKIKKLDLELTKDI
jgi:HK97 family phage prohead protease